VIRKVSTRLLIKDGDSRRFQAQLENRSDFFSCRVPRRSCRLTPRARRYVRRGPPFRVGLGGSRSHRQRTVALDGIGPRPSGFPAANGGRSPSPRLSGGSDHDSWRRFWRQGPVVMVHGNASHQQSGRPPIIESWAYVRHGHDSHDAQSFSSYSVGGRGRRMALGSPPNQSHTGR
jgi:hypothetical protein